MIGLIPWPEAFVVPPRKITHYLRDASHLEGGPKARFFLSFGFERLRPNGLAVALSEAAAIENFRGVVVIRGSLRYRFQGLIAAPDGREPEVYTVWQLNTGAATARLITARPKR